MKKVDATWPDSHWDPNKMARAAASTYELTGVPCCTVPFCLTLEGEALGCPLDKGSEMTQPQIMEHLETGFDEFELPGNFLQLGRIPVVLEAIPLLAKSQRDIQPVNMKVTGRSRSRAPCSAPSAYFSPRWRSPKRSSGSWNYGAGRDPLSRAAIKAGADTITLSDPVASGDLLSARSVRRVRAALRGQGIRHHQGRPTALHICGYTKDLMPHITRPALAFSFEEKVEVKDKEILATCARSATWRRSVRC